MRRRLTETTAYGNRVSEQNVYHTWKRMSCLPPVIRRPIDDRYLPTATHCPNRDQREDRQSTFGWTRAICGLAQLAAPVVAGGPSSTVGTYSNSWSPPSKVRLSTRSSLRSGYPS